MPAAVAVDSIEEGIVAAEVADLSLSNRADHCCRCRLLLMGAGALLNLLRFYFLRQMLRRWFDYLLILSFWLPVVVEGEDERVAVVVAADE